MGVVVKCSLGCESYREVGGLHRQRFEGQLVNRAAQAPSRQVSVPVSYTHLDVYKRQLECCARRYDQLVRRVGIRITRRMRKMAVQQGRSERRGESYSLPYGERLSDARTPLADFFRILLMSFGIGTEACLVRQDWAR